MTKKSGEVNPKRVKRDGVTYNIITTHQNSDMFLRGIHEPTQVWYIYFLYKLGVSFERVLILSINFYERSRFFQNLAQSEREGFNVFLKNAKKNIGRGVDDDSTSTSFGNFKPTNEDTLILTLFGDRYAPNGELLLIDTFAQVQDYIERYRKLKFKRLVVYCPHSFSSLQKLELPPSITVITTSTSIMHHIGGPKMATFWVSHVLSLLNPDATLLEYFDRLRRGYSVVNKEGNLVVSSDTDFIVHGKDALDDVKSVGDLFGLKPNKDASTLIENHLGTFDMHLKDLEDARSSKLVYVSNLKTCSIIDDKSTLISRSEVEECISTVFLEAQLCEGEHKECKMQWFRNLIKMHELERVKVRVAALLSGVTGLHPDDSFVLTSEDRKSLSCVVASGIGSFNKFFMVDQLPFIIAISKADKGDFTDLCERKHEIDDFGYIRLNNISHRTPSLEGLHSSFLACAIAYIKGWEKDLFDRYDKPRTKRSELHSYIISRCGFINVPTFAITKMIQKMEEENMDVGGFIDIVQQIFMRLPAVGDMTSYGDDPEMIFNRIIL
ncbi:2-succinyl-5-enolpyruvyl-6-hydroxy-3-cyclohexene-1-carboxylate synthase [Acrasis kona]|uniref:2-succinyl-5-enolpyruvyl-6-hydroxy-3-cyclohexene-1-carboxylate synthase n=1 Tax=Acrasis kona TaxID=1008807 RepID=A0AAW2ZRC2_9EUKA